MTTVRVEGEQSIEVPEGGEVTLEVSGANTTGYLWKLDANPEAVEIVGHEIIADENSFGGAGVERFTLKALRQGEATVRLELRAPWESDAAESHDVHVHALPSSE